MPNYTPTQPLPRRNFSKVWDALAAHLSAPGTELARFVKTYQLGQGREVDAIEPADWVADLCPVLRLDLEGGGSEPRDQATHKTMAVVTITVGAVGTRTGDMTDFWEAVTARLWPSDRSLYTTLKPLGVMNYHMSAPAFGPKFYSDSRGMIASGRLGLNYEFQTII